MGISCEINLCKPLDGAFHPGTPVTGIIKYAVDEATEFKKITVSLKGMGRLRVRDRRRKRHNKRYNYHASEEYVDVDHVVQDDSKEVPIGSYEINFNFKLPESVPSTLKYYKHVGHYFVRCSIKYYIRIKFDKTSWFSFAKHFRKDIDVVSGITPRLTTVPTICGERKTLTQIFASKPSIVNLKATIKNSVIPVGGKIEIDYEVLNDTDVIVKSVETKLVEVYTFYPVGRPEFSGRNDVPNADSKSGKIDCGATQTMPVEIKVPSNVHSIDCSEIIQRSYEVTITVELPMPHRNLVLSIPVQVGDVEVKSVTYSDPPPSYWEAMGEGKKKDDDDDEDGESENEESISDDEKKE